MLFFFFRTAEHPPDLHHERGQRVSSGGLSGVPHPVGGAGGDVQEGAQHLQVRKK